MPNISIVIPCYNHPKLINALLMDLYQFNKKVYEVVIVDDGSDATTKELLSWWRASKMLPITILRIQDNIGFLSASNIGVKAAKGEIVLLISNDVRITRPILDDVQQKLTGRTVVGARFLNQDTGWNNFEGRIFPYLEGYLLAFYKSTWIEVGGFDERYAPNDFEDIDISTSWIKNGYSLMELDSDRIIHLGGQTIGFSDARATLTTENKEKFRKKWINV